MLLFYNMILILFCGLLPLNRRAWGEHLTSQLSWVASCLLVARVCPVYLVVEFSPCVLRPLMIGLIVVLLTFFWMVSMVLLLWGVDTILGNGWNLRTKLCCIASGTWNVSTVSLQGFDVRYAMFWINPNVYWWPNG